MRSLLALGLVVLTAAVLAAAGGDERTDQQQTVVNITPRTKGQNSGRETVIVPKAIIRIDTTLVSIPAVVTDPLSRFVTASTKNILASTRTRWSSKVSTFLVKTPRSP
jgi:hypothetical protein